MAFAEVEKFLDTPVKRYSSGMYVRLAFAVAAHLEPEILVVDEVLAVGDAEFQKKCLGKMQEVSRGGRTVLFVSHNMAAVEALCSRALLLSAGQLAMDGHVREVRPRMTTDGGKRDALATLLMLAFDFPPLATVGVHRSVRLARHLPEQGIRPVVITTDRESLRAWSGRPLDDTLVDELPPDLTIYRVPCPRPAGARLRVMRRLQHFFSSGEDIGRRWAPHLTAMWDRVVAETKPSALLLTAPPFSVVPHALTLARRSGLPLIIDFRDAWSQWCHNANPTWWHYRAKLRAERACVEGAQAMAWA